jgi:hypothetical protein
MNATAPLADVLAEARRLAEHAEAEAVALRLIGGAAIHLRAGARVADELRRVPKDIDVAVAAGAGREVASLLASAGYEADEAFNVLEGSRRMLFRDMANERQLDVFVREFAMCHRIPIEERLLLEPLTIPLAELLLTKLQIVELNPKDAIDALAMLQAHEVAADDGATINAARIADLCARDWGLCKTATLNLDRLRGRLAGLELPTAERERIAAGITALSQAIDAAPKSRGWRMRARLGERVRWYEQPDEIDAA